MIEAANGGSDRVLARVSYTLQAGQEIERLEVDASGSTTAINLVGNEAANVILGNAGANLLDGRGGNDVLQGYGGSDSFRFSLSPGSSAGVDRIVDFTTSDRAQADKILLSGSDFGLAKGALAAGAFKDLSTGAADADDRVLYDKGTGALYYDADGSGSGARVQFASLDNKAALTATDFTVV